MEFKEVVDRTPKELHTLMSENVKTLERKVATLEAYNTEYIVNRDNNKTQRVLFKLGFAPAEWQTKCGWKFTMSNHEDAGSIPKEYERICTYCSPAEKRSAMQQADDDTFGCDSDSCDSDNT